MAKKNEEFELRGINHLALVCKDMARTVDFYTNVMGMPLTKTIDLPGGVGQHFFFDIGNGDSLAFFWFPEAPEAAPGVASPIKAVGFAQTPSEWITAHAYEPQRKTTRCANCDTLLRKPEWPQGPPREGLDDYPNLQANHGLVCSRCQSVSCYRCCEEVTKNRTPDGSFLCPRCSRGPMNEVFHF